MGVIHVKARVEIASARGAGFRSLPRCVTTWRGKEISDFGFRIADCIWDVLVPARMRGGERV
jgi:hypothetical protein